MTTVQDAPRFSESEAERIALEVFDVRGKASGLPSERDQNFRVATDDGTSVVLKIANATERREVLDLQNRAMAHVGANGVPCPRVRGSRDGETIATVPGRGGETHLVRLLTWLEGVPLARVNPHRPELLHDLGRFLGSLTRAFESFDAPEAHRKFYWDLQTGAEIVRRCKARIDEGEHRARVERFLDRFEASAAPSLGDLPRAVIHNDANDHNVLVKTDDPWQPTVSGLIDFGDMVHSFRVGELAVGTAYAMLDKTDPIAAAREVVAGYHAEQPLSDVEIAALFPLIGLRLVMSASIAAEQRRQAPDNAYLDISQRSVRALLERLDEVDPELPCRVFRQACGMIPSPRSRAVVDWLRRNRGAAGPVVDFDLTGDDVLVFDLGVAGSEVDPETAVDADALTRHLFGRMRDAGARVGIGRYDEARFCYAADQFVAAADDFPERRSVHLGIDIFLPAGSRVLSPLDGVVHSFKDNDLPLDYGPTVILEHRPDGGEPFFTLYGHLSRESLADLVAGREIARGETVGRLGDASENGGWPPHLHFQVVTDVLGMQGNYPGVAEPSRREVWLDLCPDPNLILGIPAEKIPPPPPARESVLADRKTHLAPSLSLAYRTPIRFVRGYLQHLYDDAGQAYLDAVNNICHVGHCHPRVVRAGREQMGLLNTNTRYLVDRTAEYARRLCATMPEGLDVCFLVSSGSEANELALRMARAHTGRRNVIVVGGAYHGNTQTLVDVSPYKYDGPGGAGRPSWVYEVPMPDGFRGPYRGKAKETGIRYAEHVSGAEAPAAFLCESLLGCGGQIVLPDGYLEEAYRRVRKAGGVCIADEVQVGFGRVGTHFWGFETQRVIPDIVTLGKPIGNGHPLAAVVTTRAIAESFANGMEYFSSFGGNPVSSAIGMAVLDVIEGEGLQRSALEVGERLKSGLAELAAGHAILGDVRGSGLFLGVELVRDRESLEPAAGQANYLVERLREHGILVSADGPDANVVKIKPPMVFDETNAERLLATFEKILREDFLRAA